jgi:hypothetical protein
MTETARRLARLARPHARARLAAVTLGGVGLGLLACAAGMWLAPNPTGVLTAWLAVAAVAAATVGAGLRVRRGTEAARVSRLVEETAGARAGSIRGLVSDAPVPGTSAELFGAADRQAAAVVDRAAPAVRALLGRASGLRLLSGAVTAVIGTAFFFSAAPASGRAAAFWNPVAAWRAGRSPVRLAVDRLTVARGEHVTVEVGAAGATRATLWTRVPGEPWRPQPLPLGDSGVAVRRLGPLEADLHLRATAGGRASDTVRVRVALPLFAGDLEIVARFPDYLARPDEPVVAGPAPIALPAGTRLTVRGRASGPLAAARWAGPSGAGDLVVRGDRFEGAFVPRRSGTWTITLAPAGGDRSPAALPALTLDIVPDAAPAVIVAVPGADTTAPLSLRQPLVADVRDDYGISRVEIVSWRVSQTGRVDAAQRETVPSAGAGDRAIVQGELNLEGRGLLPGDTLRYYVAAWDNAPVPQRTASREYALRLPSRAEMRAAARAAAASVAAAAESVAAAQGALADRARDLAAERVRGEGAGRTPGGEEGALGFRASERAAEIARQQAELEQQAGRLAESVADLARAVEAAGLDDSSFLAKLDEVRELLERALTPELERRLRELQEALQRLDPDATREALERLAAAQRQLQEELERSRELFQRAALEGTLSTLAADAEELARQQDEWTREAAPTADSAAARAERALAARADSLRAALAEAARDLAGTAPGDSAGPLRDPRATAERAGEAMRGAERAAAAGDPRGAARQGEASSAALDSVAAGLREERDSVARSWREEALAALDRALAETAALAEQQADVAEAMRRGETGASIRARQGAVEDGAAAVEQQVRAAGSRNALVSPQIEAALSFAQRQMRGAREQLNQAQPNAAAGSALAEEAVDALNATAHALARARGEVAGAASGTGFAEAVEALTRMAGQQRGIAGDGQGLMPMLGQGGQAVLQQLRALAARQRALAEQLEQLQATGSSSAAGALAEEARELARQLDQGRLDRRTVERQERLFRRLLDAGRTLEGEEPDPERDRTSRAARPDSVRRPAALTPGATGRGPRVRYPTWDELRGLTPEQRRLVLEYYRRLNAP